MQLRKAHPHREQIPLPATQSFAARQNEPTHFPFAWHHHPEVELTLILKGSGFRYVGDSVQPFTDGDLVLLGPDLPHTWHSSPAPHRVASQVIQFLPTAWGEEFLHLPELIPISHLLDRARHGLTIAGPARDQCRAAMAALLSTPEGSPARLAHLLEALSTLASASPTDLRPLSTQPADSAPDPRTHAVLKRVLDRLHDEHEDPPTQSAAARLAHMTPSAFSRFFHREMGKPYVHYLNDWRIGRACRLLAETDTPITHVAYQSGFNNLANFNRRFRATKQMTPRAYRRLTRPAA